MRCYLYRTRSMHDDFLETQWRVKEKASGNTSLDSTKIRFSKICMGAHCATHLCIEVTTECHYIHMQYFLTSPYQGVNSGMLRRQKARIERIFVLTLGTNIRQMHNYKKILIDDLIARNGATPGSFFYSKRCMRSIDNKMREYLIIAIN